MRLRGARAPYRFCWECSRQLHGGRAAVVRVHGVERFVHHACAEDMKRAGEIDAPADNSIVGCDHTEDVSHGR